MGSCLSQCCGVDHTDQGNAVDGEEKSSAHSHLDGEEPMHKLDLEYKCKSNTFSEEIIALYKAAFYDISKDHAGQINYDEMKKLLKVFEKNISSYLGILEFKYAIVTSSLKENPQGYYYNFSSFMNIIVELNIPFESLKYLLPELTGDQMECIEGTFNGIYTRTATYTGNVRNSIPLRDISNFWRNQLKDDLYQSYKKKYQYNGCSSPDWTKRNIYLSEFVLMVDDLGYRNCITVELSISATGLPSHFLGTWPPSPQFKIEYMNDKWLFHSEIIKHSSNPRWKSFDFTFKDIQSNIRVEVFDFHNESIKNIGSFEANLTEIRNGKKYTIRDKTDKVKGRANITLIKEWKVGLSA